jgi:hypothetical protein
MSRSVALILTLIIGSIFVIGINNVYGDTYTELIEIPIPDNITGQESKKQLTQLTDELLEYTIIIRFHLGQNGTEWFEKELTDKGITPPDVTLCPDRFYLDDDGVTCYPITNEPNPAAFVPLVKPAELVRFEEDLQEFLDGKEPVDKDELDYFNQLKELDKCLQGLLQAQGIQNIRTFYTSEFIVDTKVPRAEDVTLLDLRIDECKAQRVLLPILGDERAPDDVKSQQGWYGYVETPHGERAIVDAEAWPTIPTHESDSLKSNFEQVSEHDLFSERKDAFDNMCSSPIVLPNYKEQQGCPDNKVEDESKWNDTGVGQTPPGTQFYNAPDLTPAQAKSAYMSDDGDQLAKILAQKARDRANQLDAINPNFYVAPLTLHADKFPPGWQQCPWEELDADGNKICIDVKIVCTPVSADSIETVCKKVYG